MTRMSRLLGKLFGKGDAGQEERAESLGKTGTVRAPQIVEPASPLGARAAVGDTPADHRLIAVLTAAVAAFEEDSAFRIASIHPVRNFAAGGTPGFNTPVWGRVDRLTQVPFQR